MSHRCSRSKRAYSAMDPIYHVTTSTHWAEAQEVGEYVRSTGDQTLAEVGFIHCSFADQVPGILERFWGGGGHDVVVLTIDSAAVGPEVRVENGYPHIYGPLSVAAVAEVRPASEVA